MLPDGSIWQGSEEWVYLLRVAISSVCGLIIGLERAKSHKEAGMRTHILVALGAAMMMVVSKYGFFDVIEVGVSADATRIGSTILTAISFLGAGIILQHGSKIRGLTTAAGVWVTGGVGIAVGAGMYALGLGCTLLVLVIQIALKHFTRKYVWNDIADNLLTLCIQGDAQTREAFAIWLRANMPEARVSHIEFRADGMHFTLLLNALDLERAPSLLSKFETEES